MPFMQYWIGLLCVFSLFSIQSNAATESAASNLEFTGVAVGSPQWISASLTSQNLSSKILQINSADDAIAIDNSTAINVGSGDFSVSFWFFLTEDANGNWRSLMRKSTADTTRTFSLWLHPDSNRVHFRISTSGSWNDGGDSTRALSLHQWTQIVYVKTGSRLSLYLNGVLDSQVDLQGTVIDNNGLLYIGASPWNQPALGNYHQVNVYPRSLSILEIDSLYQQSFPPVDLEEKAQLSGTPEWILSPKGLGEALQINSDDDSAILENSSIFAKGSNDFSVAFWFLLEEKEPSGRWRALMHKGNNYDERTFGLWLWPNDNRLHFRISTSAHWNEGGDSQAIIALNQWTHIVYVKQGNTLNLYLNGALDSSAILNGNVISNEAPLYIGKNPWAAPALAQYDNISLFQRALKADDVTRLYQSQALAKNVGGQWSEIIPWPHIAVSAANLPDGRVLTWSGSERTITPPTERTYSAIWNPLNQKFLEVIHSSHNMFCAHLAMTDDGKVFVNGGNNMQNSPWTSLFNFRDNQWTQVENMATGGRWYPTTLALPSGEIMTAMGTASNVANPEKWSANKGWQVLNGVDFLSMRKNKEGASGQHIWWPLLSVAPSGEVFHFWSPQDTFLIDPQGIGQYRQANAHVNTASMNNQSMSSEALAPGVAIQYDVGKMLITGNNQGTWGNFSTRDQTFSVDLNGPTPVISAAEPMHFPRAYHNAVVLPTGEVLVVGGNTSFQGFSDEGTIYDTEIWSPATRQWRLTAAITVPRNYHSIALLLTDGRVLSAGGGYCSNDELCNNASHQNGQIYSPAYLFNSDGTLAPRPILSNSPGVIKAGEAFTVTASSDVTQFSFIKMSATTHAVNTDTRFTNLSFVKRNDGKFSLTVPANPNVLIPGYWMLFALNANHVPSIAQVIRVEPLINASTPGPNRYVKLVAKSEVNGNAWASVAELNLLDANHNRIDPTRWVISTDSANRNYPATFALDDKTNTFWHSEYERVTGKPVSSYPHQLLVDLGASYALSGLTYLPRQDMSNGRIGNYEVWLSGDALNWKLVKSGAFANSTAWQTADFSEDINTLALNAPTPSAATQSANFSLSASRSPQNNPALLYKWSFGDGTPETVFSTTNTISHVFQNPGIFVVVMTIRDSNTGVERSLSQTKMVYEADIDLTHPQRGLSSSSLQFHPSRAQLWAVNADNNSISVIGSNNFIKQAEINVGLQPSALAFASNGDVWVTNKRSGSISIIDAATLTVKKTVALPNARSLPHGIVIQNEVAFVALEAQSRVAKISTATQKIVQKVAVLNRPRHLALSPDGSTLYVNTFITPPVVNESTATPDVSAGVAGVMLLRTADLSSIKTINLQYSNAPVTENTGPGIPNYLGALAVHPLGHTAYLPSKQDNILAGSVRGAGLSFDQTVRAISSRLNLRTQQEQNTQRINHDNASVASAAVYDAYGIYLFTALEGNRQVAVSNTLTGSEILRINVGRAPQGLALSADGRTLAVHNFMDRSVQFFDIHTLVENGDLKVPSLGVTSTVAQETLSAQVLRGKQMFYDASDDRLAALDYMSCASCHHEGDGDGRTWDMTQFGEGLRNTLTLRGKGGMAHGRLHWSGNFDEVQDFEAQIRGFAGGSGLMSDSDFFSGTRSQPLGVAKAGVSADLDALAAYVSSLKSADVGPLSQASDLSSAAGQGKVLFEQLQCASCHSGAIFTDSNSGARHDIGTLTANSGSRLFGALDGLDTPTLLGLASSAPYLHNGSAKTLQQAIAAHSAVVATPSELNALARYLLELK